MTPSLPKDIDRSRLLDAFDMLAQDALEAGTRLDIAVYGGSALMLASNFRFASEDVDIGVIDEPWPDWLTRSVRRVADRFGLDEDWLNDAVTFHLSELAGKSTDHREFGTFPRGGDRTGLTVFVPTADYMLAMKLKAMRVNDPAKGEQETSDILNLMEVLGLDTPEDAVAVMGRFYPKSASQPEKQLFLLRHLLRRKRETGDAPRYLG